MPFVPFAAKPLGRHVAHTVSAGGLQQLKYIIIQRQLQLFVAFHGSWNTSLANARDCKIQRIRIEGGQPTTSESFVNGWRAPGETGGGANAFGRPADVVVNSAGEMFISDDVANAIYRVIYVGP